MKPQRKNRPGTASNNYCGGGGGFKLVLRRINPHPHPPPRFTQFSWLFGSHGGLLAHQCVVTTIKINEKTVMERQLQRVETPGNPLGISNTTETLQQKKATSWNPMGQETDKSPGNKINLYNLETLIVGCCAVSVTSF